MKDVERCRNDALLLSSPWSVISSSSSPVVCLFRNLLFTVNRNGTYFQVGDHVRVKRTQETGTINATDGGVMYVLLDASNGTNLFSAYVEEDAYIELVTARVHCLTRNLPLLIMMRHFWLFRSEKKMLRVFGTRMCFG